MRPVYFKEESPARRTPITAEQVTIDMNDGQAIDLDIEAMLELSNEIDHMIREAWIRRIEYRSSRFDFTAAGLVPVTENINNATLVFALPHGRGIAPWGVPVITFHHAAMNRYSYRNGKVPDATWTLRFSTGMTYHGSGNGTSIATAAWDDLDGIAGLVTALTGTPTDDLITEAALMGVNEPRSHQPRYWSDGQRWFNKAMSLPALDFDAMNESDSPANVAPAVLFDPQTCRRVAMPGVGVLKATDFSYSSAPELDRLARRLGVVGLPSKGELSATGRHGGRLVVARGKKSGLGTAPAMIADTTTITDANLTPLSTPLALATNVEVITLTEREALLAK